MNNFGEFLYSLRKEKGITQADLAERLGVTNKAVSKWETGEAMPETGLLKPLSQIFGVTVDELLDGKRSGKAVQDDIPRTNEIKEHLFTDGKEKEPPSVAEKVGGLICAAVMFAAITAFLVSGAITNVWHPLWVIIPVSALSCGIVGIICDLSDRGKRENKLKRGENPYTGALCGGVILSCVITYLLLGATSGLWHPYWVIIPAGALFCAVVGAAGNLLIYIKKK